MSKDLIDTGQVVVTQYTGAERGKGVDRRMIQISSNGSDSWRYVTMTYSDFVIMIAEAVPALLYREPVVLEPKIESKNSSIRKLDEDEIGRIWMLYDVGSSKEFLKAVNAIYEKGSNNETE